MASKTLGPLPAPSIIPYPCLWMKLWRWKKNSLLWLICMTKMKDFYRCKVIQVPNHFTLKLKKKKSYPREPKLFRWAFKGDRTLPEGRGASREMLWQGHESHPGPVPSWQPLIKWGLQVHNCKDLNFPTTLMRMANLPPIASPSEDVASSHLNFSLVRRDETRNYKKTIVKYSSQT